jgi:4-hydroxy-4-methyl-2-oxoglutarate aldolase
MIEDPPLLTLRRTFPRPTPTQVAALTSPAHGFRDRRHGRPRRARRRHQAGRPVATDGYTATAVVGDLVLGMARNRGVVAMVTDGCVRDIPGILAVNLPCFAAGVTPNSPARNGPGTAGLPVVLGGVTVCAGDIVLGDGDGVVVVPFGLIDTVIGRLPAIREAEAALDAKVKAGLEIPDFVTDLFAGGRVREVE